MSDSPWRLPARPSLEQLRKQAYEKLAMDFVAAYRGDAEALQRLNDLLPRSLTSDQVRTLIQQRVRGLSASASGAADLSLADAEPTDLLLDGPFTGKGLASLAGLDGLFGLSFFWHTSALTADGLKPLAISAAVFGSISSLQ